MNLAIISDIHSNYVALETCLEYLKERAIDEVIFLGDYVSDCPYPQKTLALIDIIKKTYRCRFIRGNREDYQINHHDNHNDSWKVSTNSGSLLYTYQNLTSENLEFFRSCDITDTIKLSGYPSITICHGSPLYNHELLHRASELADKYLKSLKTDILICGHTHIQDKYTAYSKTLINPGSVGIPIGSNGKAQFAILHGVDGRWEEEFLSLDYDIEKLIDSFETSGFTKATKVYAKIMSKELRTGHNYLLDCLSLIRKRTSENGEILDPMDIPEKYFEEAVEQLGL